MSDPFDSHRVAIPARCGERCWIAGNSALGHPDYVLTCHRALGHEGRHGGFTPAGDGRMMWMPFGDDPNVSPPTETPP